MFTHFKKCNAVLNGLALLTMAASIVVGPCGNRAMQPWD